MQKMALCKVQNVRRQKLVCLIRTFNRIPCCRFTSSSLLFGHVGFGKRQPTYFCVGVHRTAFTLALKLSNYLDNGGCCILEGCGSSSAIVLLAAMIHRVTCTNVKTVCLSTGNTATLDYFWTN